MKNIERKISSLIVSILIILTVSIIDFHLGGRVNLSVFYVIPFFLITWHLDIYSAVLTAILCMVITLFSGYIRGYLTDDHFVFLWELMADYLLFFILIYLLNRLKIILLNEKKLARIDPLTGISNRHDFFERLENEIERAKRYNHPISIVYIDCDNFKIINDTLGHEAGDEVLRYIAEHIKKNLRRNDITARLGGDEFVIVYVEIGENEAVKAIEKMRESLLKEMQRNKWDISFSMGMITFY